MSWQLPGSIISQQHTPPIYMHVTNFVLMGALVPTFFTYFVRLSPLILFIDFSHTQFIIVTWEVDTFKMLPVQHRNYNLDERFFSWFQKIKEKRNMREIQRGALLFVFGTTDKLNFYQTELLPDVFALGQSDIVEALCWRVCTSSLRQQTTPGPLLFPSVSINQHSSLHHIQLTLEQLCVILISLKQLNNTLQ